MSVAEEISIVLRLYGFSGTSKGTMSASWGPLQFLRDLKGFSGTFFLLNYQCDQLAAAAAPLNLNSISPSTNSETTSTALITLIIDQIEKSIEKLMFLV